MQNITQVQNNKFNGLYFNPQNTASLELTKFTLSRSYVPMINSLYDHIVTTQNLTSAEKLLYVLVTNLAHINFKLKNIRAVSLPASSLASMLGRSRNHIYTIQQTLEEKGYISVVKNQNPSGQHLPNMIIPIIPADVFNEISTTPSVHGEHAPYDPVNELQEAYLERTQLYIPLNFQLLKTVMSDENLNAFQKLIWIDCYMRGYKNYMANDKASDFSFVAQYNELIQKYAYSRPLLCKTLNVLEMQGFMTKKKHTIKSSDAFQERKGKSLWHICVTIPTSHSVELLKIKNRKGFNFINKHKLDDDHSMKIDINTIGHNINKFCLYINKDLEIKKSRSRGSNFLKILEEKKIINGSQVIDSETDGDNGKKILDKTKYLFGKRKSLAQYYPVLERDVTVLRRSSGRDFDLHYVNKLILKLASSNPDHGFFNDELFFKYMTKALKGELRQAVVVNNTNFKFKAEVKCIQPVVASNVIKVEADMEKIEKYLDKIECSRDINPAAQLKRKIAGRFESEIAYKILKTCRFVGIDNSRNFIINTEGEIDLNEYERAILLQEIKAAYDSSIQNIKFKINEHKKI